MKETELSLFLSGDKSSERLEIRGGILVPLASMGPGVCASPACESFPLVWPWTEGQLPAASLRPQVHRLGARRAQAPKLKEL